MKQRKFKRVETRKELGYLKEWQKGHIFVAHEVLEDKVIEITNEGHKIAHSIENVGEIKR